MDKELWKDIEGYEGIYQVSNYGNVRRIIFKNGLVEFPKIKNLSIQKTGNYDHVILTKNNIKTNYLIHRLVAQAFVPNPNNLKEVNHIDENARNNNANNLEWCKRR